MYIDTSSLVAYYLPESKSHIVQQILSDETPIQISQLTETEILSAFNKKVRMEEVDKQKADEAYQIFQSQRKQNSFQVFDLTHAVFKTSQMILRTTSLPLRTLNALHLGTAYEFELKLFTFDKLLLETAKEFNIPTVSF